MSSSELPYFCPRCGDRCRFPSVPELRAHLVSRHTYETLLVLSQARSSRPALLPLPSPPVSDKQASVLGLPLPLACLDLASSSASIQLLGRMLGPAGPEEASAALAVPGSGLVELGLTVGIGLEERLGLERRISWTFAEVEDRVNRRVGRLKVALHKRETQLQREKLDGQRLRGEKKEAEERAAYLSRQVSAAMEMMERLKRDLQEKEAELSDRQQDMVDIECFLRDTAEKEAEAKSKLQVFIETLLARADRAERQLLLLGSDSLHNHYTRSHLYADVVAYGRGGCDDIITNKIQETGGNRRSYSVSGSYGLEDQLYRRLSTSDTRTRTLSLGSGGWDGGHYAPGGRVGEAGWGTLWGEGSRRYHSTEEEEEEEPVLWSSAGRRRVIFSRTDTPGSEASLCSTPSRRHGDTQLEADTLRLRAGLFCVFPYLDLRSLLRVAEVCSDWRFVARHPAVWTRLRLENGRVSAQFLITLSQWCSQTQSVVLHNLKPRIRRASETREDYHRSTRGCLELGLEAVLRSAGGSLLHLSVSRCPRVLTDRTLWLSSCYCRNLQTLTYRSSSDPVGHEVLWALGAGCRSISSLQVAPAHPCQQPTRFGDRCLQTIGRCWPHLRSLSVGGASCGTQGLVDVVRSCAHLQLLELERVADLGLQAATELCHAGLTELHTLVLMHTPVSGQAILHFHGMCDNIRSIVVEVSASDYFQEPDTQEAQHLFGEILSTLKVLQQRPGLCDVLQVKAEGL